MLRQTGKELAHVKYVAAKYTQDSITLKDANHLPHKDGEPEIEEVLDKMSNIVLNEKHDFCNKMDTKIKTAMIDTLPNTVAINNKFFEEGSTIINEMSNNARNYIGLLLDSTKDLNKNCGQHFDVAKNKTAADVANKIL